MKILPYQQLNNCSFSTVDKQSNTKNIETRAQKNSHIMSQGFIPFSVFKSQQSNISFGGKTQTANELFIENIMTSQREENEEKLLEIINHDDFEPHKPFKFINGYNVTPAWALMYYALAGKLEDAFAAICLHPDFDPNISHRRWEKDLVQGLVVTRQGEQGLKILLENCPNVKITNKVRNAAKKSGLTCMIEAYENGGREKAALKQKEHLKNIEK